MTPIVEDLIGMVKNCLEFPYPMVCRHSVAYDLLCLLDKHGLPVSEQLARAVIRADDDAAIRLLPELGKLGGEDK